MSFFVRPPKNLPSQNLSSQDSSVEAARAAAPADGASLDGASPAKASSAHRELIQKSLCFEEVVERYHGKVFQLIYRYTGDYEEACDLTQDTFVRAYKAWGEFRGDSQIYTWLYRIALNLCHNQQKKRQRRQQVESTSLDAPACWSDEESSLREFSDERPLPLQVLEGRELRVRLHAALRALPENYRVVIVLRDIEGLSYEEIARITGSTLEAIKSRLFRARNTLRQLLTPYLLGAPAEDSSTSA